VRAGQFENARCWFEKALAVAKAQAAANPTPSAAGCRNQLVLATCAG
jgi:hypothetical protein